MTSKCFVYVTPPGTTARRSLSEDRHGIPIGRFVYGRHYLAHGDAVSLDPLELPLQTRTFEADRLKGVFGAPAFTYGGFRLPAPAG